MKTHALRCLGPHGFHRVAYYDWGETANPRTVLCVHGMTRNGRDFDYLARALAPRMRVVCPDVVGRGGSDWLSHAEDYGYPVYVSDMAALLARTGADQVDLIGTSMGGLIGMMLAAQPGNPIRQGSRAGTKDADCHGVRYALTRSLHVAGCKERKSTPSSPSRSRSTVCRDLMSGITRRTSFPLLRPTAASIRPSFT